MKRNRVLLPILFFAFWLLGACVPFYLSQVLTSQDSFGVIPLNWQDRLISTSLSPDRSVRVLLVEASSIERNIDVYIQQKSKSPTLIYRTGDLSTFIGSERVVWTNDSSQFVLLSRMVNRSSESADLKTGESLLLIYDRSVQKLYCPYFNVPSSRCFPLQPQVTQQLLDKLRVTNNF